ncbi:MAG: MFS transporter [Fibrobacteraceae bacterium]|nr:MFS transporter [Fibrobacteraceae bacterium]
MENTNKNSVTQIFALAFAHLVNDWYGNLLATVLPLLVLAGISVSKSAFLISIFTLTSSVMQPIFGFLVDRYNQKWLVYVGTVWMAVQLSLIGLVQDNYTLLMLIAALSGLGTAAFHPQASFMVGKLGGSRKAFWMGFFISMGNVGMALTPLLVIPYLNHFGLEKSPFLAIPGIIAAIFVLLSIPRNAETKKIDAKASLRDLRTSLIPLLKILSVVSLRSWAYFSLIAFLPLFYQAQGIPLSSSSRLVFLMLFTGALGGLFGGYIWDKIRGKTKINWLLVLSLVISSPLFFIYLHMPFGILSLVVLGIAGAFLLATFSVTVIMAQEAAGKSAALASGLMLGLGVGIGGLGVSITGLGVEHFGIAPTLKILVCLPLLAGLLATTLRSPQRAKNG